MNLRKIVLVLAKITLLDELFGFAYWFCVIVGIFLAFEHVNNLIALSILLIALVVIAPIAYIKLSNALKSFFSSSNSKSTD